MYLKYSSGIDGTTNDDKKGQCEGEFYPAVLFVNKTPGTQS